MKFFLAVVAILGLANALPTERGLMDELQELIDIMPVDEIRAVVVKHYAAGSFDSLIAFSQNENLPTYVEAVRNSESMATVLSYLESSNVDTDALRAFWQRIRDLVAIRVTGTTTATKSITDFWADLKAVLPLTDMKAFWVEKKETSEYVQRLVAAVTSDTFKSYIAKFAASSEYQAVISLANSYDFDLEAFVQKVRDTFGW